MMNVLVEVLTSKVAIWPSFAIVGCEFGRFLNVSNGGMFATE